MNAQKFVAVVKESSFIAAENAVLSYTAATSCRLVKESKNEFTVEFDGSDLDVNCLNRWLTAQGSRLLFWNFAN